MSAHSKNQDAHMENLYGWLCMQDDIVQAVESLEDYALRDLGGYLGRCGVASGIPSLVYGVVLHEGYNRFMKEKGNYQA